MAPRPKPTLPASLFESPPNLASSLATPAGGHPATRPSEVILVLSGTADHKATDQLLQTLLKDSDGLGKGPDGQKTIVKSVVYQLAKGETVDDLDQITVAKTTSGIPITAIQPLFSLPPTLSIPPPSAPPHLTLSYSLPTISKPSQITDYVQQWNETLKQAHERQYTLEFNLTNDEKVREGFEELLGKNFESMLQEQGEEELDTSKGAKFVIDNFGSPPLDLSSSELLRSESLRSWAEFISRLALHPRLYVKLSPLSLPSLLSSSATPSRPSDSNLTSTISDAASTITSSLKNLSTSDESRREEKSEMARKIRIFLDVLLEAFGEDRLIWSSDLKFSQKSVGDLKDSLAQKIGVGSKGEGQDEDEKVTSGYDTKEWFEVCREKLADMGVSKELMEKIFRDNASKVYRL